MEQRLNIEKAKTKISTKLQELRQKTQQQSQKTQQKRLFNQSSKGKNVVKTKDTENKAPQTKNSR